jgi:catechol 2,3-dioxygenase-like lactoylglutathione lyase family enzyme
MIERFDHLVIGVRDLDAAVRQYRDALGFDVRPGGRHTGRGTENALVRFGLDYLELISIYDQGEAERAGRETLGAFLRRHQGGLVSFALATSDIEAAAAHFGERKLDARGPFPMERLRPDGSRVTWRLLVPGGDQYRRPWPFLIQWDQSDDERLQREAPGRHPNGARAVREVAVAIADLDRAVDLYGRQLGMPLVERRLTPELAAERADFTLGFFQIALLAPTGPGLIQEALDTMGEGPFQAVVNIERSEDAHRQLAERGTSIVAAPGVPGGLLIDQQRALGARLVLSAESTFQNAEG